MKTALITGASRGIGAAIAENFIRAGYTVTANYNRSYEAAIKLKERLGDNLYLYQADIGNFKETERMCKFCTDKFNGIDVLVNNAGISQIKPFADISEEEWDEIMRVNLKGIYNCTKNVLDNMIHRKEGKIINIASIWGETGASCEVPYSAAKAGVIGFTKALAKELALSNIQVNCVSPGIIDTDMNKIFDLEELKKEIPMNKIGRPEDIADAVLFLASKSSDYITGQVISVNGGM